MQTAKLAAVGLASLMVGCSDIRWAWQDPPPPPPPTPREAYRWGRLSHKDNSGRWQLIENQRIGGLLLFDSATGEAWVWTESTNFAPWLPLPHPLDTISSNVAHRFAE